MPSLVKFLLVWRDGGAAIAHVRVRDPGTRSSGRCSPSKRTREPALPRLLASPAARGTLLHASSILLPCRVDICRVGRGGVHGKPNPLCRWNGFTGNPNSAPKATANGWRQGRGMCGWRNRRRRRTLGILCGWIRQRGSGDFVAAKALIPAGKRSCRERVHVHEGFGEGARLIRTPAACGGIRAGLLRRPGQRQLQQLGGKEVPEATLMFAKFSPADSNPARARQECVRGGSGDGQGAH